MDHSPFKETLRNLITLPYAKYKSIQNFQTSQDYIFHILQCFAIKLHNFTKFRTLFPAVLMNIPNLKVCLKRGIVHYPDFFQT